MECGLSSPATGHRLEESKMFQFKKKKELKAENEALRAENEALKSLVQQTAQRLAKQWENFFHYDGRVQPEVKDED